MKKGIPVAKRLDKEYTEIKVKQILGRVTGFYTLHLFGPERNDYYTGKIIFS